MKQWHLNTLVTVFVISVILFAASVLTQNGPATLIVWALNFFVYLVGLIGFQIALPFITGLAFRYYLVEEIDKNFGGRDDHLPNWLQILLAIATGIIISSLWLWLTPYIALLPTFSVWPVEFFRWVAKPIEMALPINYLLLFWSLITGTIGWLIGWGGRTGAFES